jgi:hypothetical protein
MALTGEILTRVASPFPAGEGFRKSAAPKLCWALILLALLGYSLPSASQVPSASSFDRKAWQEDYSFLKRALEQSYANLAWFASPQGGVDIPALDRRTQEALDHAMNNDDAKTAIFSFVAGFHDGHFSRVAPPSPPGSPAANAATPALGNTDASADCAAIGYASTTTAQFSLPFEDLDGFQLEASGIPQTFRAGVYNGKQGFRFGVIRIQRFRTREFPAVCVETWNQIKSSGKPVEVGALRQGIEAQWFLDLALQLRRFQAEHVTAVIVDVGNNGGGGDEGDWTARLFTDRPVHSARLLMAAASPASAYFDEELLGLHKAIDKHSNARPELLAAARSAVSDFERQKSALSARYCDMSWVWRERRPWSPSGCSRLIDAGFASGAINYMTAGTASDRDLAASVYWPAIVDPYRGAWSGPVYVLINGKTHSAAEMFAAVIRDNGIAKLVGSATGGDGCGFMHSDPPTVLPNSGLQFRVPDCVRLRADGTDEVAGIQPDLAVSQREGESPRTLATRVLDAIQMDLPAIAGSH